MIEPEAYRPKINLYRCSCRHCDAAQEELGKFSEKYGAVLEVQRVERDERLRGFAGWSTPIVAVDGVGIWFRLGARPEGHEACARECWEAGGPVGIAAFDGRVFLALPDKRDPSVFAGLKERPGEKLRVEGEIRVRDGVAAVVVSRAEAA